MGAIVNLITDLKEPLAVDEHRIELQELAVDLLPAANLAVVADQDQGPFLHRRDGPGGSGRKREIEKPRHCRRGLL